MEKSAVDLLWVIVSTCLVFLMQAGFLCLETGFTRSKNNMWPFGNVLQPTSQESLSDLFAQAVTTHQNLELMAQEWRLINFPISAAAGSTSC